MRGPRNMLLAVALLLGVFGSVARAAPRAQFRMDGQPHVDVPFELDLMVEGFGEAPVPELPTIAIADATVTPLGATPNVARSIQIVNGQRTESATVTWVLRYRVEVSKPGTMRVPSVFVQQGSERAIATAGTVTVDTIPTTDDMKLALVLPDRPVFVGETVQAELVWLFRAQPEEQNFIVPLMASDVFTVTTPPIADKRTALSFTAGSKDIPVPYVSDTTTVGGVEFRRIRFTFFIAPHRAGKIEIPAAKVVAGLAVGRRDFFGNAATRPFRAVDVPRTIEVKPLPETGRPAAFTGAVGDQFSIAVSTSRSVVQLGEPMAVQITVKSNQRLDTLALGKLDGEGGLPKDKFAVPAEPPTGTLSDDGLAKTFELTAQVVGPATEIPAIAFAYFDPAKAEYQTIHSDPIALSVKGGSIVGADAVVAATPRRAGSAATISEDLTLVPVELALSSGSADEPIGGAMLWLLVGLLYLAPLGIFGVRTWQLRTREAREDRAEVRSAKKKVLAELERAKTAPAREAIGPLVGALRDLARALARDPGADGLIGKLETAAFAPSAADRPLADDLRAEIAKLVDQWSARPSLPRATAVATLLGLALVGLPLRAHAEPLAEGRAAYGEAMQLTDAPKRKLAFARAEAMLGEAVRATPDAPALLADWGNAALGAGDVATATLAYRRALATDGGNARARQNLAWLREKQPDAFRPTSGGAADSLFWFHAWPRSKRLLVGGVAFAVLVLLVVPWTGRRRRLVIGLAVFPAIVWLAMLASLVLEDRHVDDAIVMDEIVLRAADSSGAPAAFNQAVPRGAEVAIVERRGAWTRIRIANGTSGWVQAGALQPIASR